MPWPTIRRVPRRAHAIWEPPAHRRSPVELLEEQAATRVPELVPLRYGRMLVSPFTFYRGAAYLMASDLSDLPQTSVHTQLCGDAHLSNFGVYAAPDRTLVFDVNDFDETLPGPFEWDLKRLVTSFAVAGRDRGLDPGQRAVVNTAASTAYREAMHQFAELGTLDLWYSRVSVAEIMERISAVGSVKQVARARKNIAKAQSKDSLRALGKLTETFDGEVRIRSDAPVVVPIHELFPPKQHDVLQEVVRGMVRSYRETLSTDRRRLLERFRYVDAARKVVGVGSVGTRAWIMLLLGRDDQDPLFLQFKEAEASVLEPFLASSKFKNHGRRVVEGQRLTQAATDVMLGWLRTRGPDGIERDYYVRQLWDQKGSALVELMNARALAEYARICGRTLARAHARAGDAVTIAAYLGRGETFDRALARDELRPDGRHAMNVYQGRFPIRDSGEDGFAGTAPVGSFPANGYGLHEMTGNVWEWTADWFDPGWYRVSPRDDPHGPASGIARAMRGGSYLCHASYCNRYRVDARSANTPDSSTGNIGFRVTRDP